MRNKILQRTVRICMVWDVQNGEDSAKVRSTLFGVQKEDVEADLPVESLGLVQLYLLAVCLRIPALFSILEYRANVSENQGLARAVVVVVGFLDWDPIIIGSFDF